MPKLTKALKNGVMAKVIAGVAKGESGKVMRLDWAKNRVWLEKINMQKRHTKPNATNKQGGIIEKEGSIHLSNVVIIAEAQKAKAEKSDKPKKASKRAAK